MADNKRTIVVGTTADYIQLITEKFPGRAFFVTDFSERAKWKGKAPSWEEELLLDLEDERTALAQIRMHIGENRIIPSGVVCFDCESLALAADLAEKLGLPFTSKEAVMNCRSKYRSKKIWKESGISCPDAALVRGEQDVIDLFDRGRGPIVIKPLTGSGSELVFLCRDRDSCRKAYGTISEKLRGHGNIRMYTTANLPEEEDPRRVFLAESYIAGEEYSCDFIVQDGQARVLRLARKLVRHEAGFGTISGYILQKELSGRWTIGALEKRLLAASESLGVTGAIAMADFKIEEDEVFFLEITPRPGGDCLPPLIKASSGLDMIGAAFDLAEGNRVSVPEAALWNRVVGFHLIASTSGVLKKIEASSLAGDPRIFAHHFKRTVGDRIELPPEDYDSRILGYVLFRPESDDLEKECLEISGKVKVEIEQP